MVKNYMEIIVEDVLEEMLKTSDLKCKCDECQDDIKAIALNNLQPIYIATERGALFSRLNEFSIQFRADVIREILNAIDKVKKNPRH